jgi:hypothetical protein
MGQFPKMNVIILPISVTAIYVQTHYIMALASYRLTFS